MGTVIAVLFILAVLGGCGVMLMNSPVEKRGYSSEFLERTLGCVKVGSETLTGRYSGVMEYLDVDGSERNGEAYVIMTRNDDLEPPYQVSRTIQCPDCKEIVLPISGCRCQLSNSTTPKPLPLFNNTAPASFAHAYFFGYPKKA